MTARKKTKKKASGRGARKAFQANLKSLEGKLPAGVARRVREMGKTIRDLERQIDKARSEREVRWHRLETQIRKDAAKALRRLEHAIEPSKPRRKKTARKRGTRKKVAASSTT